MRRILLFLFLVSCVMAGEVRYDLSTFVEQGMQNDPQLEETRQETQLKKDKIRALKAEAILPTFYVTMMVGPAPGLKQELDGGDTIDVYDFSKMGPFWGVEGKFIQPLNFGQYNSGKEALEADLQQKSLEVTNKLNKKEVELQSYYYNYLLALEMTRLAEDAQKQVDNAYEKMEEALDEDDGTVSQMDFLNLKAKMHTVKEGVIDARLGMQRVQLAIRFSLGLKDGETFVAEDSLLLPRSERMPTLEEVRSMTSATHPELKQLAAGIKARRVQMDLAEAMLAPEFFVMGQIKYVKSWAGNRKIMQKDAFAEDAVNKLDGLIGVGLRYNLNFWKNWEKFRSSRTDYRALKLKERYAEDGLVAKAEEQYYQLMAAKEKMEVLKESLRASESILKGAAMQYDLDKSKTGDLVSAYTQEVSMKKDYYFAVCKYNVEFAQLIFTMGYSLKDFHNAFKN